MQCNFKIDGLKVIHIEIELVSVNHLCMSAFLRHPFLILFDVNRIKCNIKINILKLYVCVYGIIMQLSDDSVVKHTKLTDYIYTPFAKSLLLVYTRSTILYTSQNNINLGL